MNCTSHRRGWSALGACALLTISLQAGEARAAEKPEVLIEVGFGPAGNMFFGPVFEAQPLLGGLKLSLVAIANEAAIKKNLKRVPKEHRKMAKGLSAVRIRPLWFLPDQLYISPPIRGTGMYGVNFHPIGVGIGTGGALRASVRADLAVSYAYVFSDRFPTTHFLRPGVALGAEFELSPVKSFGISTGWQSTLYLPQEVGSFGFGPLNRSMWHEGQVFLKFAVRTPYEGKI